MHRVLPSRRLPGQLELVVPGLFGPPRLLPAAAPRFPALESLLARAAVRRLAPESPEGRLLELFGLHPGAGRELPVAALTRLHDVAEAAVPPEPARDERGPAVWMRADPVHWAVTRSGATLLDAASCRLGRTDAEALAAAAREIYARAGAALEVARPQRWYLRLPSLPRLLTVPPGMAVGRDLRELLPAGPDRDDWARLASEAQMALHASDANRERERRGEPPINALWCWGAGVLPPPSPSPPWTRVYGDAEADAEALLPALARLHDLPYALFPETAPLAETQAGGRLLAVAGEALRHCRQGDGDGWRSCLERLWEGWLSPAARALRGGRLGALRIVADEREFLLGRYAAWRFWRRRRPFAAYLRE
ncbi:MAG: hypothetical protein OXU54_07865 [Gammaproteobacteria bacterium]|nr:hypothetical protein [Gammaproteobacteria bacterium]